MQKINDITTTLHLLILPYVKTAKVAVDCTCGNGYDSKFIIENIPEESKLYCFDIQEIAIENSKVLISSVDRKQRAVKYVLDSHENIDIHINDRIDVALYNLGYLPGADHSITTEYHSTISSIDKTMKMLSKGGVISILIYSGHENGKIEKDALLEYFDTLDKKRIKLMRVDFPTSPNNPPEIYILQKVKELLS